MPVMVIGPDGAVGRAAVDLLLASGGEVRALVAADEGEGGTSGATAAALRARGVKVAHGSPVDEGLLESALEQVHTVLHLLPRPTDEPDRTLEAAATTASAAIGAGCRRVVLLSDLAVAEPAGNPWLAALAEAEELLADAPLESLVLRTALVHGPADPLTVALAAGALGPGPAGGHAPVAAADVAAAAVLADRQRDVDPDLHVDVAIAGPTWMPTADLVAALARRHPAAAGDPLPAHAVELLRRVVEPPAGALRAPTAV